MNTQKTFTDLSGVYGDGCAAGIKSQGLDLSYIFVPGCVGSAGVFTKNQFPGAPIIYNRELTGGAPIKAVIINSGNSNAATGEAGLEAARETARFSANLLGLQPNEVAVSSTGIIGVPLPLDKIKTGLETLLVEPKRRNGRVVAKAILTTDLVSKEAYYSAEIDGHEVIVAGVAKGSGMIAPNMATLLGYVFTNLAVKSYELQRMLMDVVDESFNMVSVDTDTSTSDMVLAFATGEVELDLSNARVRTVFCDLLRSVCVDLAKKIARDGEGATKLIEVEVCGAKSQADARLLALNVVGSPLVKAAIHGEDPNRGRIVMAAGKDPRVMVDPQKIDVSLQGVKLVERGVPQGIARAEVAKTLKAAEVTIVVDLQVGEFSATAWGCDLSRAYVDINTAYN